MLRLGKRDGKNVVFPYDQLERETNYLEVINCNTIVLYLSPSNLL